MAKFVEFIGQWSDGENADVLINIDAIAEVIADTEKPQVAFIFLVGEDHKIAIYEPYAEVKAKLLKASQT